MIGYLDDMLMIISGVFLVLFRRDRAHLKLWLALIAYWMGGGVIQDLTGGNSIPLYNWIGALLCGLFAVHIASAAKTYWPLIIALAMGLTMVFDIAYMAVDIAGMAVPDVANRAYQQATYIFFFASLLALSHPTLRGSNVRQNHWVYA